jgi:hypothetical protein
MPTGWSMTTVTAGSPWGVPRIAWRRFAGGTCQTARPALSLAGHLAGPLSGSGTWSPAMPRCPMPGASSCPDRPRTPAHADLRTPHSPASRNPSRPGEGPDGQHRGLARCKV